MQRITIAIVIAISLTYAPAIAQQIDNSDAPEIPFVSVPDYLKYSPEMNLGETLAVAVRTSLLPEDIPSYQDRRCFFFFARRKYLR